MLRLLVCFVIFGNGSDAGFLWNLVKNFWKFLTATGLPWWLSGKKKKKRKKEIHLQCRRLGRRRFNPWVGQISWRREWQPTPIVLPEKSHRQRSLAGYSPLGHKESDMTEQLSTKRNCVCFLFPESATDLRIIHIKFYTHVFCLFVCFWMCKFLWI